jgi:hypothetical protein
MRPKMRTREVKRKFENVERQVVCYVRHRELFAFRSIVSKLQISALREYCVAHNLESIATLSDRYMDDIGITDSLPALDQALTLCRDNNVPLLYVDLQSWRRHPIFKRRILDFIRGGGRVISYVSDEVIKALRGATEKNRLQFNRHKVIEWAGMRTPPISPQRINNLIHLISVETFILQMAESGVSDTRIADKLHDAMIKTVTNRRWTKRSVCNAREAIHSNEYLELKKFINDKVHGWDDSLMSE